MTSNSCPNNVWNHTDGCVCVPNGSVTSEAADIDLTPSTSPITSEMLADALGDGPDLNDDEQRLLAILLDARNHYDTGRSTEGEWILEDVSGLGNETDTHSVKEIAGLIDAHYAREAHEADPEDYRAGTMAFNVDGDAESYTVDVYLGNKMGGDYLSSHHDLKYFDPERYFTDETSGLRKAIHHARTIDENFQSIRAKAIRLGLLKNPRLDSREQELRSALRATHAPSYLTGEAREDRLRQIDGFIDTARPYLAQAGPYDHKSPWPENDDEKVAFVDWQNEAANGDTNASFRDWYENPDRNMDDED